MGEMLLNKPIANTFRWLHVNGTKVNVPDTVLERSVDVKENGEETVVTECATPNERFVGSVGENGTLRLIQIRRKEDPEQVINDVSVRCAKGARFEWYRVILGGAATYDNCSVAVEGEESSFAASIGYKLGGTEKADINCEAIHTGPKSRSDIYSSGVLSGQADKLLRGTIDLRHGCVGAEGTEMEDVLLMDEDVRNRTVPVILCTEEDVAGAHGATIGRPDADMVYYLQSRGVPREETEKMLARAKMDAIIRRIPAESVRDALLKAEDEEA